MSRKFYCSVCGIALSHSRKAVGREILDLVDPHDCEGYAMKAYEGEEPTVKDLLEKMPKQSFTVPADAEINRDLRPGSVRAEFSDKRTDVKSTAPKRLLDALANGEEL